MEEIIEIRKNRSKYCIILDNNHFYYLTDDDYSERHYSPGDILDEEELNDWLLKKQYRKALDKAVSMLAVRACSKGEIEKKLCSSGYTDETVKMVLYKLEKENLIDDRSFSSQWANYRFSQKYGPKKIAYELRTKGINNEQIVNTLKSIDKDRFVDQAYQLALKGFSRKKEEDIRKTYNRVISSLVRRGYDWETARNACEKADLELKKREE